MFSLPVLLSLALVPFVSAQDNTVGIKAIEAHFKQSHLVPNLFDAFEPTALLSLNFGTGDVQPGQKFAKEQVGPTPAVTVTAASSSDKLDGTYTLAMIDADVVDADISKGVTRHWLVNGVKVEGGKVTNASATAITAYAGPWPAAGSGPHRYVVALYDQPEAFAAPEGFTGTLPVDVFVWSDYVKDSKLGALVAANYITVEEGTATASIPVTSAVVSSTLAPSSTSGSSTGTGTTSNTASPSGTAANNSNGAVSLKSVSPLAALFAGLLVIVL
jgi:phosphatidylethanolamine-binding protein (PEBP) family uncharacterized protein